MEAAVYSSNTNDISERPPPPPEFYSQHWPLFLVARPVRLCLAVLAPPGWTINTLWGAVCSSSSQSQHHYSNYLSHVTHCCTAVRKSQTRQEQQNKYKEAALILSITHHNTSYHWSCFSWESWFTSFTRNTLQNFSKIFQIFKNNKRTTEESMWAVSPWLLGDLVLPVSLVPLSLPGSIVKKECWHQIQKETDEAALLNSPCVL